MTDAGSSRRVVGGTVVSGVVGVLGLVVTVILVPFVLGRVGPDAYGVWTLAVSFSAAGGYLALSDLGLQAGLIKRVAEAQGEGDVGRLRRLATGGLATLSGLGIVGGLVVAALAVVLPGHVDTGTASPQTLRILLLIVALEVALFLPSSGVHGILQGLQRHGRARSADAVRHVVLLGVVLVALRPGGPVTVVGWAQLAAVGVSGVVLVTLWRTSPEGRGWRPLKPTRREVVDLASYSSWVTVSRASGILWSQMDKLILAAMMTTADVAVYDVANRAQLAIASLLSLFSVAVMPAASFLHARDDQVRLRALVVRGTKLSMVASLPVTIGLAVMADIVIRAWVGEGFEAGIVVLRALLAYQVLVAAVAVPLSVTSGLGHVRRPALWSMGATLLNLAVSIVLTPVMGINGVVVGTFGAFAILVPAYLRLADRVTGVPLRELAVEALLRPLLLGVLLLAALVVGRILFDPQDLPAALAVSVAPAALYALAAHRWALGADDRALMAGYLGRGRR